MENYIVGLGTVVVGIWAFQVPGWLLRRLGWRRARSFCAAAFSVLNLWVAARDIGPGYADYPRLPHLILCVLLGLIAFMCWQDETKEIEAAKKK